ncbi:MAG: hypothetical protein AAF871_03935 [Pseudomonadota bacterium]
MHPELLHLLNDQRVQVSESTTPAAIDPKDNTQSRLALFEAGDSSGWPKVVLRQDGQHPLVFRGLLVWVDESDFVHRFQGSNKLGRRVEVYCAEDGRIFIGLAHAPKGNTVARPEYRASMVTNELEFQSFIQSKDVQTQSQASPGRSTYHAEGSDQTNPERDGSISSDMQSNTLVG